MKKIVEKWYFGLIIIPILINLFKSVLNLPDLLKNWNYTLIVTLIIICTILIYEILELKKQNNSLNFIPKNSDKKILNELIETLNIDEFQEKICEQSCWYGYEKKALNNLMAYCEKVRFLKYKTTDKKLNQILLELSVKIEDFHSLASTILYSNDEFYFSPDKSTELNYKKTEKVSPLVDEKSGKSFRKLEELLYYVKSKNYFE